MLALWIILGFFALVGLLLTLPLGIFLRYTSEEDFSYRVKYAFIVLASSDKERKANRSAQPAQKKDKPKSSPQGARRTLLNFLGLGDLGSADDAKQAIREKGLLETLRGVSGAVFSLFRRIFALLDRGVFRRFTLRITVGGDDPAETALRYGSACAAIYPLISLLGERIKFGRRSVKVLCDYNAEETQVFFDGHLVYRPWHILHLFFGLVFNYFKTKKGVRQS